MSEEPKTVKKDSGVESGLVIEDTPQRTPEEIYAAAVEAAITSSGYNIIGPEEAQYFIELFRELLHYQYTKPGTHPRPGEMVTEWVMMARKASTDAPPLKAADPLKKETND